MLVIQGTATGTNSTIFPADKCTWNQVDPPGGVGSNTYTINNARFYTGNAGIAGLPIATPVLGQIGKSGRFVALTG